MNEDLAAALVKLAEFNIPTDIQELLIRGDPYRDIPPGALAAALATKKPLGDLPEEMTPAIEDALGVMPMSTIPIAHALQFNGHNIKKRVENEQAYVLFWFLKLAVKHGEGWRNIVADELDRFAAKAKETLDANKGEEP